MLNWSEPRKSYKSSEHTFLATKKIDTTCLNTPIFDKDYKSTKQNPHQSPSSYGKNLERTPPARSSFKNQFSPASYKAISSNPLVKNCPFHFNTQQHVCLTCRKSVCLRCAITYCQDHLIKAQKEIMPILLEDLRNICIRQKLQQIEIKLSQSQQRQEYYKSKACNLFNKIQDHFTVLVEIIVKKKNQIISYFQEQYDKGIRDYRQYHLILNKTYAKLKGLDEQLENKYVQADKKSQIISIERVDQLGEEVRDTTEGEFIKFEKKINKLFAGKDNKILADKLWSEQKLEKVLYELEHIRYKIEDTKKSQSGQYTKKRVITEGSDSKKKPLPNQVFSKASVKNQGVCGSLNMITPSKFMSSGRRHTNNCFERGSDKTEKNH